MKTLHVVSILFLVELATALTRTILVTHTLEAFVSVDLDLVETFGKTDKAPSKKTISKPTFSRRSSCSLVTSRTGSAKIAASVRILIIP